MRREFANSSSLPNSDANGQKSAQSDMGCGVAVGGDSKERANKRAKGKKLEVRVFRELCLQVAKDVQNLNSKLKLIREQELQQAQKMSDALFLTQFDSARTYQVFSQTTEKLLSFFGCHQMVEHIKDIKHAQYILPHAIKVYARGMEARAKFRKLASKMNGQKGLHKNWAPYLPAYKKRGVCFYCQQQMLQLVCTISEIKFHPYYAKLRKMISKPSDRISLKLAGSSCEKLASTSRSQSMMPLPGSGVDEKQEVSETQFLSFTMKLENEGSFPSMGGEINRSWPDNCVGEDSNQAP